MSDVDPIIAATAATSLVDSTESAASSSASIEVEEGISSSNGSSAPALPSIPVEPAPAAVPEEAQQQQLPAAAGQLEGDAETFAHLQRVAGALMDGMLLLASGLCTIAAKLPPDQRPDAAAATAAAIAKAAAPRERVVDCTGEQMSEALSFLGSVINIMGGLPDAQHGVHFGRRVARFVGANERQRAPPRVVMTTPGGKQRAGKSLEYYAAREHPSLPDPAHFEDHDRLFAHFPLLRQLQQLQPPDVSSKQKRMGHRMSPRMRDMLKHCVNVNRPALPQPERPKPWTKGVVEEEKSAQPSSLGGAEQPLSDSPEDNEEEEELPIFSHQIPREEDDDYDENGAAPPPAVV